MTKQADLEVAAIFQKRVSKWAIYDKKKRLGTYLQCVCSSVPTFSSLIIQDL
jgi:hypothetical protein